MADDKLLFKAKTTNTLYFYRDTAEWSLDKPYKSDYYDDGVQVKRMGCNLSCYYAKDYLEDTENYNDVQIIAVFNDGLWILFDNISDIATLDISICEAKNGR